jgi:hypothetical protein|tara:strand:+ start:692 stop:898 length:207 start_codon:yes stop_codon:yes gene_type:complete
MMTIEEMRDALAEDEINHIQSLSSKNLFHYVKDTIISTNSDDEVRKIYDNTMVAGGIVERAGEVDETD